jgi:hypothetical protein
MKPRSNSYYMLISSLPPLPPRFERGRLPISLERLNDRLRMLEPEDAQEIARLAEVLRWSQQFEESSDRAVVKGYDILMQGITTPLIRELLTVPMDMRMITVALRRRRRGLGPPAIGVGRYVQHIRRHFNRPDLGLSNVFPGIVQLGPLLEQGDVLNCQRGLLGLTWSYLRKLADNYYFSFEAVVLYVARWNIIRQWHELEATRGRAIFETLVEEALGEHANIES